MGLNLYTVFGHDKTSLSGLKAELVGNEAGNYFRGSTLIRAKIPAVEDKLQEIYNRFDGLNRERKQLGYGVLEAFPPSLQEERLKLEARLDIYAEELDELNRRLGLIEDKEAKAEDAHVLAYGLQCYGKLFNGKLHTIDNQSVAEVKGVLIIADDRSPYNGMSVQDYRELAKQWQTNRKNEQRKKLLRLQMVAKEQGHLVPSQLSVRAPHKVAKSTLPPFPANVKNYLKNEAINK